MDFEQIVNRRKGRAMAQLLEEFERELEPLLPAETASAFKALVRRKLNSFADDVTESMKLVLGQAEKNGAAQDIEDRLFADTRNQQRGNT